MRDLNLARPTGTANWRRRQHLAELATGVTIGARSVTAGKRLRCRMASVRESGMTGRASRASNLQKNAHRTGVRMRAYAKARRRAGFTLIETIVTVGLIA